MRTEKTGSVAISDFLARSKNLLAAGQYIFVPRGKNLQALAVNGLTIADAKREIMDLIVEDYYKGPKQDFDANQPGDIWEFKKDIEGGSLLWETENSKCQRKGHFEMSEFPRGRFSLSEER